MRGFGQELRDGTISLDAWRNSMRNEIRQQHLIAAMAAKGGRAQMTPADYGRVGQLVRKQYGYLEKFALDVDSGKVPLNGAFLSRSAMYSQASRGTYHAVERTEMMARQMTEERNILGKADHCPGCLEETARQWVGIGQLVPPGQRTCKVNCKCRLRYRDATGKESAA